MGWGRLFNWLFNGRATADQNLSVTLQFWVIAAAVPLSLFFIGDFGRSDFNFLWIAGKMALLGAAGHIYDPIATQALAASVGHSGPVTSPYPPHALFFFIPFALVPHIPGYFAWIVVTAAFFYWAAKPWVPAGFPPVLVLLTPAALTCFDFGQTGFLFGALWLLAFRGSWPAVSLLSFKPHLGLLAILSLRDRLTFLKATLLVVGVVGLSATLFGPSLWVEFVKHTLGFTADIGAPKRWLFAGVTPAIGYGFWGWIPFAVGGALLLARNVNAFTAATASFLISPYGFHYDMPVACLGFGLIIFNNWHDMPIPHRIPIALGFLSPVISIIGAWWVPPILIWSLWTQSKYGIPARKRDS